MTIDYQRSTTIASACREQADLFGHKHALIQKGFSISFHQLNENANRVADGLLKMGIEPGDRIALLGKDSLASYEIFFGAAKVGAVLTPINWRLSSPEIQFILVDSGAKALFFDGEIQQI